jgi:hypothetical protein
LAGLSSTVLAFAKVLETVEEILKISGKPFMVFIRGWSRRSLLRTSASML